MTHTTHRPRRPISPKLVWLLRIGGFRYSHSRDAYVLRGIGNDFGPVFKVRVAPLMADSEPRPGAESTAAEAPRPTELAQ